VQQEEELRRRMRRRNLFIALLVTWTLVLIGRLYYLQVIMGDELSEYASGQRLRKVYVPAARGQILDRRGEVLATNRPAYSAYLVYTKESLSAEARQLLSSILGISEEDIQAAEEQLKVRPVPEIPVRLKAELTQEEITALAEYRDRLPGVIVEPQPLREYPHGPLAAHVLGYVSQGDRPWRLMGMAGIEKTYDGELVLPGGRRVRGLAGVDGQRLVEVDARGRPRTDRADLVLLGPDAEKYSVPPQPGNNVVLTIDARVQRAAEEALARRIQELRRLRSGPCPCPARNGAAVAIDVRSGAIIAMASYPAFDPNVYAQLTFVERNDPRRERLVAEVKKYQERPVVMGKPAAGPLLNIAIQSAQPPGSTFKPITGLAAMVRGVLPGRVSCSGGFRLGSTVFKDWQAHGATDFTKAIGRSCNVYFYQAGLNAGIDAIASVARQFGLGEPTGLRDLAGEQPGMLSTPETFQAQRPRDRWTLGQVAISAIGQGINKFTPLQMAVYTATLANGGTRYRPYLVQKITDPQGRVLWEAKPEPLGTVDLPTQFLERTRRAMVTVTRRNGAWYGTAAGVFADAPYVAGGKTGTAQVSNAERENHGWFIAFAPAGPGEEPEIAVAVLIHNGGGGALAAAPVARAILDAYFAGRYGLPADPEDAAAAAEAEASRGAAAVSGD